jgi:hypothetical protein
MKRRDKILEILLGQPAALVLLVLLIVPLLSGIAVLGYQDLQIISAPGNPPSGYLRFSAQTGALGCLTSAGANCLSGISSPLTTKGDLYTFASANARLAVGTNGQVLYSNSGATNGIDWEAPISLTTTGTSGASTYTPGTPNVLNIPQYSGGGGGGTVSSIATTAPLGGGTITTTGTLTCTTCTVTIANGTSAMGTSAIASGACATTVTTTATGVATTDDIIADFNASPLAVTGYIASANGMLTIIKWPTSNNVNFAVCNNTGSSITPGAITLNWRVPR